MTIDADVLGLIWVSAGVALVFWLMHYYVAAWLASQNATASLGKALSTFFPGGS